MRFDFNGLVLVLEKVRYRRGNRPALQIVDTAGSPYTTLTVNVPEEPLANGELLIKTWSGNEQIAQRVLGLGIFQDTGRRVQCGFVVAPVWRIADQAAFDALPEP